jgi:hypothetical protein
MQTLNAGAAVRVRESADQLLRQMTVEAKAMQLSAVYPMSLFGMLPIQRRA